MKIVIELPEDIIINELVDTAKTCVWHINDIVNNYEESILFKLQDLSNHFKTLFTINELLPYYGGTPVELVATKVTFGYDIDGKKFNDE